MTKHEEAYIDTLNLSGSDVPHVSGSDVADLVFQESVDREHEMADPTFEAKRASWRQLTPTG